MSKGKAFDMVAYLPLTLDGKRGVCRGVPSECWRKPGSGKRQYLNAQKAQRQVSGIRMENIATVLTLAKKVDRFF